MTTSRRKTEEKEQGGRNPTQPDQRRGTQVEGVALTLEKGGSRVEQSKLKPTASAGRRETARRLKANPTNVGKAMSRMWTEQEHRLYQRQVTKHADYAHHQTPEARGTAAPLWPANKNPTKNQGNNHRSGATEVGQLRKKPQVSRASSQHGKREGRTQGKAQEKPGARTIQPPEMGVEEEAKASGMCDRASEETKTRSHRGATNAWPKTTPTPEKGDGPSDTGRGWRTTKGSRNRHHSPQTLETP